jgi:hypothetical protein
LLRFKAHRFEINGKHYILLPKLNGSQRRSLRNRFVSDGFDVSDGSTLTARSSSCTLHVEPPGFCWASTDPSDYLLPAVPEVLDIKHEVVRPGELLAKYFTIKSNGDHHAIRLNSRLESDGNWDWLRTHGDCGLSPDEHLLTCSLLDGASGDCWFVTDFAADCSTPLVLGGKLYYKSRLPVSEASGTLRCVGDGGQRNTYLPRGGIFTIVGSLQNLNELVTSFGRIGDWCSFNIG